MEKRNNTGRYWKWGVNPVLYIFPALTIAVHLYTNLFSAYGIFRDEFYYLACANNLSAGYVDHPPLSIYVLYLSRFIFGDSLFAIRILPALANGLLVFMTEIIALRIGGKLFAAVTAGAAVSFAPVILAMFSFYSMNFLDYLFWIFSGYLIILLAEDNQPRYWIWIGLLLGLGLLNKISVFWLGAGFTAGILLTPLRASLKTIWPYICTAIALIIFLPFFTWNVTHNFAHLEFIRNATQLKYGGITTADFIKGLVTDMNPFNIIVWLPGLFFLLLSKEVRTYRILAIIFLTAFLILLINGHSKSEYLGPAFPFLFAGGAVYIERLKKYRVLNILKYAVPVIIVISGFIALPFATSVLPPEKFISYSVFMGMQPYTPEGKQLEGLPQYYADMFGWEELAKDVSAVYQSIPDSEKTHTVIFALNYGEAGALEYYSRKYPLPQVVCPHNSYWFWGKEKFKNITTAIVTGGKETDHKQSCDVVVKAAVSTRKYAMPYENNLPIYICRKIKLPLKVVWNNSRFFI